MPEMKLDYSRRKTSAFRWLASLVLTLACLLLSAALLHEGQYLTRIGARLQPQVFPFQNADTNLLLAASGRSRHALDHPQLKEKFGRSNGLAIESILRGTRNPELPSSWIQASIALGLTDAYDLAPDTQTKLVLNSYADSLITADGNWREPLRSPEQALAGWFLLRHDTSGSDPRVRKAADQLAAFLLDEYPRTSSGTLPYSPNNPDAMLVDTLGMLCPFLAEHARRTGNTAAADLAVRQLLEFEERAVSPVTGICWHAYSAKGGPAYGIAGWTRGIGWRLIGLVETLASLPPDHPASPELVMAINKAIAAVIEHQRPDGLWGWCLTIPDAEPDTSGTAMLIMAAARAVQHGAGTPSLEYSLQKAARALASRFDQRGRIQQSLAECQAVGHYPRSFGHFPFAQGFATSAIAGAIRVQEAP
jgi:rhamnogalacturonyl hydrolase YesR